MKKLLVVCLCLSFFLTISAKENKEVKALNLQIAELRDSIDQLLDYKAKFLALTQEYKEYAFQPFSEIDKETLDSQIEEIASLTGRDARLKALSDTLETTQKNLREYNSLYRSIMQTQFPLNKESEFTRRLEVLEKYSLSDAQKREVSDMADYLNIALNGIDRMNEIIGQYENQIESIRPKDGQELSDEDLRIKIEDAKSSVEYVKREYPKKIKEAEENYFSLIPWLKEKYDRLNVLLETDPLGKEVEEIRDLFISLAGKDN